MTEFVSFWHWLVFKDRDGDRGIFNIVNVWVFLHITIAIGLACVLGVSIADLATKVAVPGAAILVGLSFA